MTKNHVLAMQKQNKLPASSTFSLVLLSALFTINLAHADLVGGLNTATTTTSNAVLAFYGLVGAAIVGWLLWEGLGLLQGRMDWKEFAVSCGKVALIGGIVILAPTLWNFFKNGGF